MTGDGGPEAPAAAPLPRTDPGPFWDEKYSGAALKFGDKPNRLLVDESWRLNPGSKVLVPGDGEGRNGLWLAGQGHDVTMVDASAVGLRKALSRALALGVKIRTECADLRDWPWPRAQFDAVVSVALHFSAADRPDLRRRMADGLKPGGLMIFELFTPAHRMLGVGGPPHDELLVTADLLRADLPDVEWLLLEQGPTELRHGSAKDGRADTVRGVARVPGQ